MASVVSVVRMPLSMALKLDPLSRARCGRRLGLNWQQAHVGRLSLSSRRVAPSADRLSVQDFFPRGFRAWPVAPCDFWYSDTELFGLSDFGFLASLLPLS
jgi:hypothetical protein